MKYFETSLMHNNETYLTYGFCNETYFVVVFPNLKIKILLFNQYFVPMSIVNFCLIILVNLYWENILYISVSAKPFSVLVSTIS